MSHKKPTAQKKAEGNPGKRALPKNEPTPPPAIPSPPDIVSRDPEALEEWSRLTPLLAEQRTISEWDRAGLATVCVAWSKWLKAEKALEDGGYTVISPNGYEMSSPYVTEANRAMDQLRKSLMEFGLTPVSRSRVQMLGEKKESKLADFEKRRAERLAESEKRRKRNVKAVAANAKE